MKTTFYEYKAVYQLHSGEITSVGIADSLTQVDKFHDLDLILVDITNWFTDSTSLEYTMCHKDVVHLDPFEHNLPLNWNMI